MRLFFPDADADRIKKTSEQRDPNSWIMNYALRTYEQNLLRTKRIVRKNMNNSAY